MARAANTYPVDFPTAVLRPWCGKTELAAARAVADNCPRPEKVTRLLAAMYRSIDSQPAKPALLRRLSCAAREGLLQGAAMAIHPRLEWFETRCGQCGQHCDIQLVLSQASRKNAGPDFPVISVNTRLGQRRFEAPNGSHEEALARLPATADFRRSMAVLCGLDSTAESDARQYHERDLDVIDQALEAISPDIADSTASTCPHCSADIQAHIEPLNFAFPSERELLREVHLLASNYHWSERRILRLPANRRRRYVSHVIQDQRAGRLSGGGR